MKFKTSINEFKKAIQLLNPIVNHNHAQLIYRYLLIRLKNKQIEIKGFDDYTIGSAFINYYDMENEDKNNRYILAKHLFGLINSFNNGEIIIEFVNDKCILKHNRSQYTLPLLDEEYASENGDPLDLDYYVMESFDYSFLIKDFTDKYNSISHCLSKDNSQRNLQNIYIANNKMIACDGIRGAVIDFNVNIEGLALHKKACDCLMNGGQTGEVAICLTNDKIIGYTQDFIFATSIDDEYPYDGIKKIIDNYDIIRKDEHASYIKFNPDEILDALNRILIFADTETNSIGMTCSKDALKLFVENRTQAQEIIKIFEYNSNNDLSLFIDGKNLKEALYKSVSDTTWVTLDSDHVQYLDDNKVLQFFNGLEE